MIKSESLPSPVDTAKAPRSPAQIQASRNNGSKSKGPTSLEGKRTSSKNGLRHGLTATEHTLLMGEDPVQYKEVIDAFIDDLRPATKAELRLVEKIGNLDWRIERLVMMETAVLNMEAGVNVDKVMNAFTKIDEIGLIVEAWKESLSATHCLELLRRYLGTLQHQFNTTFANFLKLETRRFAQKHNRDLDPEFLPPYERPSLPSLEPDLERELGSRPEADSEPEPEPAGKLNEPENANWPVTPIDIQGRHPQEDRLMANESADPNQPSPRPAA